jgi:hypothetical protein
MASGSTMRIAPGSAARIRYRDRLVAELLDDMHALIAGDGSLRSSVKERQRELSLVNSAKVGDYWARTSSGFGIPDCAFRDELLYLFPEEEPARIFSTSGTSGRRRGRAAYSPAGLALMNSSILKNAAAHIMSGLERPAFIRLVPTEEAAPEMVMAYGMGLIERAFADPGLSASVVGPSGVDNERLRTLLDRAVHAGVPVVMIGASLAFVNVCEQMERAGCRWELPEGSRMVDAGGFKSHFRTVGVDELRRLAFRSFGIAPENCRNIFGMTELASQFYDAADCPVGPNGERPKGSSDFARMRVRDPTSFALKDRGKGLLEVTDLCILDRPPVVLTGDIGIAAPTGVAVIGRIERKPRGCSLVLDDLTAEASDGQG